jgi:thiosulfate/3-mercaptopyruvate sulfurtransferase
MIYKYMTISQLISTEWLSAHLNDPHVRIVDTRWYLLNSEQGREEYNRAHIPGAIYLHIDRDLARPPYSGPGRHPLPDADQFAEVASRAGITPSSHVIAYDAQGGATAARLWWLLRFFGHDAVSLLDGGITRWIAESRELEQDIPAVPRGKFVPHTRADWVVSQDDIDTLRHDSNTLLLDSRVTDRYEGKSEPIDARPGHIPGAKNAPLAGNLRSSDDPRFLDPAMLHARFAGLGAESAQRIIAYCGSGVNACANIFALELAGFKGALLYEGSWSDWSRNLALPAALGREY